MWKFFYVSQGSFIAFKKVYNKGSSPYMHVKKILWWERLFKKIDTLLFWEYQKDLYGASAYLSMCITFTWSWIIIYNYSPLFSGLLFIFVIFMILCYPVIISIFHILIEYLHPLYAFGNLGEKIQKLTPEIESQSQLIQTEFQKDMNFGVLHSGFEKLSSTFSAIVSLVLKLERIEARANKGNLFDSAKYIGSLRSDIVTPLTELRKFLEKQRTELLRSQKELMKVRIGWVDSEINSEWREHSGWQEQAELGSKRSESLLQELSTNIAALDTMVGKMG
jgi:hypothetical protein